MADYDRVMGKLDYLEETKTQIKEAIKDKGQDILDSDTFRTYVEKIQQITDGGVKIFNTIEEMQQDPKAKEGDLAIVYNTLFTNIYYGVSFSAILIPKVITLASVSESTRTLTANGTNGYAYFSCSIPPFEEGSERTLNIVAENDKKRIELYYLPSDDGLTYTFNYGYYIIGSNRTAFDFDTDDFIFDFETTVKISSVYDQVFDAIFRIREIEFLGLFQCSVNNVYLNSTYYGNRLTINNNAAQFNIVNWVDMQYLNNNICLLTPNFEGFSGISILENIEGRNVKKLSVYVGNNVLIFIDNKLYVMGTAPSTSQSDINEFIATHTYTKNTYDLELWNCTQETSNYTIHSMTINDEVCYFALGDEIDLESYLTDWLYLQQGGSRQAFVIYDPEYFNSYTENVSFVFDNAYVDEYDIAPTQFTAMDNSYLVTDASALGRNGIITGDGTYLRHTTTLEYKNFFTPQLPTNRDSLYSMILKSGNKEPYYTFVNRKSVYFDEPISTTSTNPFVGNIVDSNSGTFTHQLFTTINNTTYHKTFYIKNNDNDRVYMGYFGYNMSNKNSTGIIVSESVIHETLLEMYGILVCLNDMTVYRTVQITTPWTPFEGFGNDSEDPNANINFINYDFINDEFIVLVDTGNWAWNSEEAPYVAMMKINGSTGVAVKNSWKIGKNGVPGSYVEVNNPRYDITTQKLVLPLRSWDYSGNTVINEKTDRIVLMDLEETKTLWVQPSADIVNYSYLANENSCYIKLPIYYYKYTDNNGILHCILKRIDNDRQIEIEEPSFSFTNKQNWCIYNTYLYYVKSNSTGAKIYRVDTTNMTCDLWGTMPTNEQYKFIMYNGLPYLCGNSSMYSINDFINPMFVYEDNSDMYNDAMVDGITSIDRRIQSSRPVVSIKNNGISYVTKTQYIYEFEKLGNYPFSSTEDLCMVYPLVNNSTTMDSTYMYNSIVLKPQTYDGTIDPFDYQKALSTALRIWGRSS